MLSAALIPTLEDQLLDAAFAGDEEAILKLIALGANPAARDEHTRTPAHLAAMHGHAQALRALIAHGASIEAIDRHGRTPALCACAHGQAEALRALLEAGANLRTKELAGETIADKAAFSPACHAVFLAFFERASIDGHLPDSTQQHREASRL